MTFAAIVIGSGALLAVLFNPIAELVRRMHFAWERHQAAERAELRRRVALARIVHIYNAAQQAMWDESLDTFAKLHR